jgi:hypothetical protein
MQLINQYNVDIKIGRVLEYFQRDNRHRQRVSAWNAKYRFSRVILHRVCANVHACVYVSR